MDIQKLLYINLGLTILTLIGLFCVIIYMIIVNNDKDTFADGDFQIPTIAVPNQGFDDTIIINKEGDMQNFSIKNVVAETQAAIQATYDQNIENIKANEPNLIELEDKYTALEASALKDGRLLLFHIENTADGNWVDNKWGSSFIGLKNSGDSQQFQREYENSGSVVRFKPIKFNK